MKIRFGLTHPGGGNIAFIFFFFTLAAGFSSHMILNPRGICPGPPSHSQMPNMTSAAENKSSCGLDYQNCLCSLLSNQTYNSTTCISDNMYEFARILPLGSFVLQILMIQILFNLDGDSSRKVVLGGRITCLFIFIGLTIGTYWNNCYREYISTGLFFSCFLPGFFAVHAVVTAKTPERFRYNNNIVTYTARSERNGHEVKSWQELL